MTTTTHPTPIARAIALLLCCCAVAAPSVLARTASPEQAAPSRARADSALTLWADVVDGEVRLRWLPGSRGAFRTLADGGYAVERRPATGGEWVGLSAKPVLPYGETRLSDLALLDDRADALQEALYADTLRGEDLDDATFFALVTTLADRELCRAAGLCAGDVPPVEGRFEYRVTALRGGAASSSVAVDFPGQEPPAGVDSLVADWRPGGVLLGWRWPAGGRHAYYRVERRVGAGPWVEATERPLLGAEGEPMSWGDSLAHDDSLYAYRVQAVSYLHEGLAYSEEAEGYGSPLAAVPRPFVRDVEELPDGTLAVAWAFDPDGDSARVVRQVVERSVLRDTLYVPVADLAEPAPRRVLDETPGLPERYYRVRAIDAQGRQRVSIPRYFARTDTTPPPPPTALAGEIDARGVVRLAWTPPDEPDVLGYRVFFSTAAGRLGARISARHEELPAATDSLDLMSVPDTVYYRVVALDRLKNVSEPSAPVALVVPDVHPPAAPVLIAAVGDTAGVVIDYVPSGSDDAAVEIWERRRAGTARFYPFDRRAAPRGERARFVDRTASAEYGYEYRVDVRDAAGLRTISNAVTGERLPVIARPAPTRLRTELDPDRRARAVTWVYPAAAEPPLHFRVYRAQPDGELTTLELVAPEALERRGPRGRRSGAQFRYLDRAAGLGAAYAYGVRAEWADGSSSALTTLQAE